MSYVTVNMEALTLCSHTSGPSRKTPGQTGQAMGWALNKAIQKKQQSFVEKRLRKLEENENVKQKRELQHIHFQS